MIVLAIGAHPDDLEISCAGTLAKMKRAGHEVVLCHVSTGDKGDYEIPAEELSQIRRKEAKAAAALIESRSVTLGLRDGEIVPADENTRLKFIELIRAVGPDMVITHAPNDYMPDHVAVSQLVFEASFLATLPGFGPGHSVAVKAPGLYYMDNLSGIGFDPTIYVDITEALDTKLGMLKMHESQLVWLRDHDNVDIIDLVETLAKMRGLQAGCAYAEGFVQRMLWARPNAVRFPV